MSRVLGTPFEVAGALVLLWPQCSHIWPGFCSARGELRKYSLGGDPGGFSVET